MTPIFFSILQGKNSNVTFHSNSFCDTVIEAMNHTRHKFHVINDRPKLLWLIYLIYLLTYSDTERTLLGSRRRFGVNGLV